MPQSDFQTPIWAPYANRLIDRLRRHHGVATAADEGTEDESDEPSELENLFQKFEEGRSGERFSAPSELPSRYIPARQLLTAIRLAASFGSAEGAQQSRQCGALTVIRGIAVEDLATLKDTLKGCFPASGWQIIVPDVTDGVLAKNAQDRLNRAIAESLDKIEPALILQTDGVALPKNLTILSPPILPLVPISGDVLACFLQSGHLSDQISNAGDLRAAMPKDEALAWLGTVDACCALRAPTLHAVLINLGEMTRRVSTASGPRLEDMTGDSPALSAARRLVADLLLWREGKAGWHEISRSALFFGPPGTGKSWLARAMGNSAGVNVVTGSLGEWQAAGHLGDMLREMRSCFAEARKRSPCILIIDEIDAIGSRIDADRHGSNYRAQVITTFLSELDMISHEEGVMIVGTCNFPERMDPAVLRAGRLDVKIRIPMPDSQAILGILRHYLHDDIAEIELRAIAPLAVGRSASELDAAIRAARSDARHSRKMLSAAMLCKQLNVDQTSENASLLWRIAVHEAGHAVMAAAFALGSVDSMQITGDGGSISRLPVPHQSLLADIEAEIAYSMGGRAAERLIFGDVSAGAGGPETSDLAKATRFAVDIETTYGLGIAGPVWHAKPDAAHLTTPAIRDRVRQRIERAEKHALGILTQNRESLENLARQLLEKRSLRAADILPLLLEVVKSGPEQSTATGHDEVSQ